MTDRRSGPIELIGVTDVATAVGLPLLTAVSWFVPINSMRLRAE